MNKILLIVCVWIPASLALVAFPSVVENKVPLQQEICNWQLVDISEAGGISDEGRMSYSISGNVIYSSFSSPASEFCSATEFTTTHSWTEPFSILTPGDVISFSVDASWDLNGSAECSSLTTGINTWVSAGATTIKAQRSKVIVSTEPTGSISNSGSWTVPMAAAEGEPMSIRAHGEQGGVGGTVTYNYQYVCTTPTAEPEETMVPGVCYPKISNISNLTPGNVLSPSVDFINENGSPVGIIGHAWIINGTQTSSVVWDGKETRIELQYTCLDHSGHIKVVTIPNYGETAAVSPGGDDTPQSGNLPDSSQNVMPTVVSVVGLVVGLTGAGISGGSLLINALNSAKNQPPTPNRTAVSKKPVLKLKQKSTKKKGPEKENKKERKNLLDSQKTAIEEYKNSIDKVSGNIGSVIEQIENSPLISPEGKKNLLEKLKKFQKKLDDFSEKVGNITENLESLQGIRNEIKNLGEKYQQIQRAHMEAFKELEDLPEGAANQLADLTTAIEGFGIIANEALKRLPFVSKVYSEEYFDVVDSFKQFSQGVRRNLSKTIFHSAVEGKKELSLQERKDFGEKGLEFQDDPEMQRALREVKQLRAARESQGSTKSTWKRLSESLFGL